MGIAHIPGMGFGRRRLIGIGAGLITSLLLVSTAAAGFFGRGHHGGGWASDPAEARERAQFAAEWALRKVDATPEQQAKVEAVIGTLVDEVAPLAERHRDNRAEWLAALEQDTVDRATLDRLRKAELELADAASASLVEALAEIGAILEPAQRRELLEHVQRHRHHRR